ncbi:recombinase family protein [Cuneatibacter caecimuris]|uniref:DNA invertase Pin-like site-specific DNA recombinase n=1 Tax=Cuneatibacter caecimuris TaxID=1796618 RepID=A0A4Q7PLD6_9FIRM|nr:recombinase family protein [Cuneatibacter caecimuris]RZT00938.1 DNA invertase Pin-like site-specific DNA recombinase [Cuneatibacter caecimuris]
MNTDTAARVALYIRVSGEEQKIKGLSLESQQERLEAYAREHGWVIVGVFVDAAKTARKNMHKRAEFLRMMELVKQNKVDLLLFCRLDRWFRSVADYYKVMEVLDAHNCGWKTIDDGEGYDTTTASGRLYINLRLSIAQNEADLDGERIAVVFDSKIAHGTVLSGACPFWLRVNDEKRYEVIPEKAAILQDAYNYYESSVSQRDTIRYIRETYGVNWCNATFKRMLVDKLAIGVYDKNGRYNDNFCDPVISTDQFDRVQRLLKNNAKGSRVSGRAYIFSSILVCEECRHKLVGTLGNGIYYYRCNQHFQRGLCSHRKQIREDAVEKLLFVNLGTEIEKYRLAWEVKEEKRRKAAAGVDRAAVRRKLTRLKELYVNELIDLAEYKKDYDRLNSLLVEKSEPSTDRPDFESLEKLLDQDFRQIYDDLSREEKRTLWRSVISEIRVDMSLQITGISFL